MPPPAESQVADILAPVAVDTAYSYRVPAELELAPGDFVAVPLGTRRRRASSGRCARATAAISRSSSRSSAIWPPLPQPLRDFVDWIARWTLTPRGAVLRMATRAPEAPNRAAPKYGLSAPANRRPS